MANRILTSVRQCFGRKATRPPYKDRRRNRPCGPPRRKLFTTSVKEAQVRDPAFFPEHRIETEDRFHHVPHDDFLGGDSLVFEIRSEPEHAGLQHTQGEGDDGLIRFKAVCADVTGTPFDLVDGCIQPNIDVLGVETAKSAQNVIVSGEDAIRYAARNAV